MFEVFGGFGVGLFHGFEGGLVLLDGAGHRFYSLVQGVLVGLDFGRLAEHPSGHLGGSFRGKLVQGGHLQLLPCGNRHKHHHGEKIEAGVLFDGHRYFQLG